MTRRIVSKKTGQPPGKTPTGYVITKTYEKIKVKDLNVDPDLQRMEDPGAIRKIEAEWDPNEVGTPVVSKRKDGSYWLCDGQHRAIVARRMEGEDFEFTCEVYHGLTRQQEAKKYLTINRNRKSPRPYDNFKVAENAGEPLEVRISQELSAWGLEAAHSPSANKVSAVETLRRLAQRDKIGGLITETFGVAIQAWGRGPQTYDGMVIEGLGRVLDYNRGSIDVKRMVSVLSKHPVGQWRQSALARTIGGGGSESRSNALANVFVGAYNNGLRTESKMIKNLPSRKK